MNIQYLHTLPAHRPITDLPEKKLVVFDLDGCLLDTLNVTTKAIVELRRELGMSALPQQQVRECMGGSTTETLNSVLNKEGTYGPVRGEDDLAFSRYKELIIRSSKSTPPQPFEGIRQILESLVDDGIQIAVLSNRTQTLVDELLATSGVDQYLSREAILGTSPTLAPKPSPKGLQYLMQLMECEPQNTIMVGDSEVDIQVARNAGCRSIGCLYGYGDLSRCRADKTVRRARDICRAVQSVFFSEKSARF